MKTLIDSLSAAISLPELRHAVTIENKEERIGAISFVYLDTLPKLDVYKHNGGIVYFDGRSYVQAKNEIFENAVFESMRTHSVSKGTLTKSFPQMIKVVMRGLAAREFKMDRKCLCFKNCILDAITREMHEFSPEYMVINKMEYTYDPDAKCPKWIKFIEEVLPDRLVRNAFQQYLGMLFIDRDLYKLEKFLVLVGNGANGKSVVFEVVTELVGKDNTTSFEIGDLVGGNDKQKNLASINGKTLNYCSDLGKKELSGATVKSLVSGEPVQARQIYSESFTAYHIPLLIANTNELPVTQDHSDGYFRRFIIIPFDVKIPADKRNINLHTELKGELSGILNWTLDGLDSFIENDYKIQEPEAIKDKLHEYKMNSNSILKFIEEGEYYPHQIYKNHVWAEIAAADFYGKYKTYCHDSGNIAFSLVKFGEKLVEEGFTKKRTQNGWKYLWYKMPMPDDYDTLVAEGKITMEKPEYMRLIGYKYLGKINGSQVWPEEVVRVEREFVDNVLF